MYAEQKEKSNNPGKTVSIGPNINGPILVTIKYSFNNESNIIIHTFLFVLIHLLVKTKCRVACLSLPSSMF